MPQKQKKPQKHKYVRLVTITMKPGAAMTSGEMRKRIIEGLREGVAGLMIQSIGVRNVDTDK